MIIVAQVLASASPYKVIHVLDENNHTYYLGMVKDCPVNLYNLEVYCVTGCYIKIKHKEQ